MSNNQQQEKKILGKLEEIHTKLNELEKKTLAFESGQPRKLGIDRFKLPRF